MQHIAHYSKPLSVDAVVTALVMNENLSYETVADIAKSYFVGAHTSSKSVASTVAKLRKDGVLVPKRRVTGKQDKKAFGN